MPTTRRTPRLLLALLVPAVAAAALAISHEAPAQSPDPVATLGLVPSFAEEFTGTTLDRHRWGQGEPGNTVAQRTLVGNAERQIYADPGFLDLGIQPVTIAKGALTITARPLTPAERMVVRAGVDALPQAQRAAPLADLAYSSGRVTTMHRFSQLYGYFETRLRFSPGRGLWPAFWLLPEDGGWPPEIDVVEILGHDPDTTYQTVHSAAMPRQTFTTKVTASADGFHRYGVLWGPETIDYYVDGVKTGSTKTPPDAHKPMYMILNLAVGGFWPGYPDAATKFPASMDVDYVRAWRLPGKPKR